MGKSNQVFTLLFSAFCFSFFFLSCSPSVDPPSVGSGTGSGSGSGPGTGSGTGNTGGGSSSSTITILNPTFTTMSVTLGSETKTAAAGASAVFTGSPASSVSGTAYTSGTTSSGTQVGLKLTWSFTITYPSAGTNYNYALNCSGDYFFLKVVNRSILSIQKLYVNYGLVAQTLDNISIANDGQTYDIGYYKAYSNSNVRAESRNTYWQWSSLGLGATNNQSVTLTSN